MKHKISHNMGLKLISLVIACAIWLIVSNNNDPEVTRTFKSVPITFRNQETLTQANKTYTVVDDIDKVTVYVTDRKSVTNKLTANNFTIRADMENFNEAISAVPLEVTCSDSHVSQQDIRVTPPSLKITMEDKVEDTYGIAVSVSGKAAKGYEIGTTEIETGDTIKIAGPASLMRIIGKAIVAVDVTDLKEDTVSGFPIIIEDKNGDVFTESQMKKLELKDANGVSLTDGLARVGIDVWKLYTDIPLQINLAGEPAEHYKISKISIAPKTVNLVGQEETVEGLGGVLVLKDYISIEGMTKTQEFTVNVSDTLDTYSNIRAEENTASSVTVTVEIVESGSRPVMLPISMITMENVPKEKKLIFTPADYVSVNVKMLEEGLEELTAENIQGKIDLKNCSVNGNYTIPVEVSLPEGYELVDDVSIVVNIVDTDNEAEIEVHAEE